MALTKIKAGQIDESALASNKSISKTDSYTITTDDIAGTGHLFVYVDSTGSTDPLEITLPTAAQMSGMLITVWVETYNKQTKVEKNPSGSVATFNAVDDYVTVTADGTKYLTKDNKVTAGGGPPL